MAKPPPKLGCFGFLPKRCRWLAASPSGGLIFRRMDRERVFGSSYGCGANSLQSRHFLLHRALLHRAEFRPEARRSRLQLDLGRERPTADGPRKEPAGTPVNVKRRACLRRRSPPGSLGGGCREQSPFGSTAAHPAGRHRRDYANRRCEAPVPRALQSVELWT